MSDENDELIISNANELPTEPEAGSEEKGPQEESPAGPVKASEKTKAQETTSSTAEVPAEPADTKPADTKPAGDGQAEEESIQFSDNLVEELDSWGEEGSSKEGPGSPQEEDEPAIAHQEIAPPPHTVPRGGPSITDDVQPRVLFKASLPQTGLMRRAGQYYWAVDIGTHTIKVVGLKQKRKSVELIYLSLVEILPGYPLPEQENSYQAAIVNALNMATKGIKQWQKEAFVSSIGSTSAVVRQVQYPVAVKDKLLSAIQWEVRKFIPYEPDDVVVDAQILSTGEKKLEVLLAAVPKENLQYHQEILSEAGLNATTVDTDSMALTNALMSQVDLRSRETALLIDIGAKTTILNMFQRDGLFFTRALSIAGDRFTHDISADQNISYANAEAVKRGEIVEGAEISPQKLSTILKSSYKRLYSEIQKSLIFYRKQTRVKDFNYLFMSGGGAGLPGLQEFLSDKLGKNIALLSPVAGLEVDEKNISRDMVTRFGPQIGLAVGLAFRMKRI